MKVRSVDSWSKKEIEALPSLAEAIKLGSKFYFSGTYCKNGHIAPRRTAGGKCIKCLQLRGQKRYQLNKGKVKSKKNSNHQNEIKGLDPQTYYLRNSAKQRAKKKGIFFDLKAIDIKIPKICPILGIKLSVWGDSKQNNKDRFNTPSIDRIDSSKGYTKDNILVISYRANIVKGYGSAKEHRLVAQYMKKNSNL